MPCRSRWSRASGMRGGVVTGSCWRPPYRLAPRYMARQRVEPEIPERLLRGALA